MVKIIFCEQGSDIWLEHRKGVATASNFSSIITPATGKESASLPKYAKKLEAGRKKQFREIMLKRK